MNEEAVSRKERLLALRAAKAGKDNGDSIISFRNYTPSSQSIDDIDHNAKSEAIINQVKQLEDKLHVFEQDAKNAEESRNKEADLFNLAPKKPDFDLRRDLDKKLEKLDRITANCVAQLIRERLKASKSLSDTAVN